MTRPQEDTASTGVMRYVRRAGAAFPYLRPTLRLIWQAAPGWTTGWVVLLGIQGFLPVAIVYLTRPLVDGIAAALTDGTGWQGILLPAALIGVAMLLTELLRGVTQWIRTIQSDLVQDHISGLIHGKSVAADLAFYESPDFYDHLHRAQAEAGHRPIELLDTLGSFFRSGITLVAMLGVVASFSIWLPFALLASTVPILTVVLRNAVRRHEFRMRTTTLERRAWYNNWLMTTPSAAPEIRLFALGDYFRDAYQGLRAQFRRERMELVRREGLAQLGAGLSALAVTAVAMIVMVNRALNGLMTLGDLALFYQAFQQGLGLARVLLENVGQLYQNSLFLGNLFEFLALEPRIVSPRQPTPVPAKLTEGIRFENVTFRYPGNGKVALEGFSLDVPAGSVVALVGPNGAGKSTLVKLLCRFYDPDAGCITIDGVDLRQLPIEDLRRKITVLFQEPMHYNATAGDNIRMGDLGVANDGAVAEAARNAGADAFIERLPEGYENLLGYWFEKGAELSTGEWQRLALARAFLRQAPIIVLDEPTSAMDPWAEGEWLERFRRLAAGRTAILVTHRFTTARLADRIHVMEGGRVSESGTHEELIRSGGAYARWWQLQ